MNALVVLGLVKAFDKYGMEIKPCSDKKSFTECLQYIPEMKCYLLYFNTKDNSTRVVKIEDNTSIVKTLFR